jgi:hypothetical protein
VDKSDKDLAMADAILAELQRITRLAAGPMEADDNIKSAIARAARRLGLNYRRARAFRYARRRSLSGLLKPIVCERLN